VYFSLRPDASVLSGPVALREGEAQDALIVRLANELKDAECRSTLRLVR
jgi:hypothetical protein